MREGAKGCERVPEGVWGGKVGLRKLGASGCERASEGAKGCMENKMVNVRYHLNIFDFADSLKKLFHILPSRPRLKLTNKHCASVTRNFFQLPLLLSQLQLRGCGTPDRTEKCTSGYSEKKKRKTIQLTDCAKEIGDYAVDRDGRGHGPDPDEMNGGSGCDYDCGSSEKTYERTGDAVHDSDCGCDPCSKNNT